MLLHNDVCPRINARINKRYRYLRYVLTEMVKGPDDLARLLPWNLDPATIDC